MTLTASTPTVRDLITEALSDANVVGTGQTPSAEEITTGFKRLLQMIAQWRKKRWMLYRLTSLRISSTGKMGYTIGPGGDFDTPQRPSKIESAFYRLTNPPSTTADANFDNPAVVGQSNRVDQTVKVLNAVEDYNRVTMKRMYGVPLTVYLDDQYPLGVVYFNPVPQPNWMDLVVSFMGELITYNTVDDVLGLPPEYEAAVHYNLAIRLSVAYGTQLSEAVVALAKDALNVVTTGNTDIAELVTTNLPVASRNSRFNFYQGS